MVTSTPSAKIYGNLDPQLHGHAFSLRFCVVYHAVSSAAPMSGVKALSSISPSLLRKICIDRWIDPEHFDLGPLVNNFLADDMEESVFAAAAEMPAVASGSQTCEFGEPVDDEYLDKLKRSAIPAKTRQQTKWAVSRWDAWALTRSLKYSKEPVPQLEGMTEKMIEFWFKRFVVEICKKDGKCYPP